MSAVPPHTEKNVLGGPLLACGYAPLTGFFRDGVNFGQVPVVIGPRGADGEVDLADALRLLGHDCSLAPEDCVAAGHRHA